MIIPEKARSAKSPIEGYGIIASTHIAKGSVIVDFTGLHTVISGAKADRRHKTGFDYMLQIDEDAFLVTTTRSHGIERGHMNHSCSPNCGMGGDRRIITMRDVARGEELAFDYAMTESSDYSMVCNCKTSTCRKVISGTDWRITALIEQYSGYFSPYLQRKIDALRRTG